MNTPRSTPQQKPPPVTQPEPNNGARDDVEAGPTDTKRGEERKRGEQSHTDQPDDGILDEGVNPQYSDADLTDKSKENESLPEG